MNMTMRQAAGLETDSIPHLNDLLPAGLRGPGTSRSAGRGSQFTAPPTDEAG
jgi:hypothetical protein